MSASAYPPVYSYPAFIQTAVGLADELGGPGPSIAIQDATVADLRSTISQQQQEVRSAAAGLPDLCSLLNRRLMEGAQDADMVIVSDDDAVRDHDLRQVVAKHVRETEAAIATFDFDTAFAQAVKRAERALADAMDKDGSAEPEVYIRIALNPRHRALIEGLHGKNIGRVELYEFAYDIEFRHLPFPRGVQGKAKMAHALARKEALEAFALELSKPGFEFLVMRYDSEWQHDPR